MIMSSLQKALSQIRSFFQWLVRQPLIEPILELLSYQRTITLLAGVFSFKLVPLLLPNLSLDWQMLIAVIVAAIAFALFLGLQKEVLVEAQAAVKTLPATNEGYAKEFTDLILKAVLATLDKVKALPTETGPLG